MSSGTLPNPNDERKSKLFASFDKLSKENMEQLSSDVKEYLEYAFKQSKQQKGIQASTRMATLDKPFHADFVPKFSIEDALRLHAMGILEGELPEAKEPEKGEMYFLLNK